jgi:hypothetical protein
LTRDSGERASDAAAHRGEENTNVPTGRIHIDTALSNLSIAYKPQKNIIRQVLPPFPTDHKSDDVYKYGQELFLSEEDARAAGAEPNDTTYEMDVVHFACGGHALHDKVARDTENNADPALNLLMDCTIVQTAKSALNEEIAGVAAIAEAMTGDYVADQAAKPWNSPDVDPYKILKDYIDAINLASGSVANALALAGPVWTAIRTNPNVLGLITGAPNLPNALITPAQFAALLEIDEVLIGRTVYNKAKGAAKKFAWGEKALLFYKDPNPGLRTLSLGYTPIWTKALAAVTGLEKIPGMDGQGDQFVQQYYWEPDLSDHVVVHRYYDQEIWAPECGVLFTGCLGTANA